MGRKTEHGSGCRVALTHSHWFKGKQGARRKTSLSHPPSPRARQFPVIAQFFQTMWVLKNPRGEIIFASNAEGNALSGRESE